MKIKPNIFKMRSNYKKALIGGFTLVESLVAISILVLAIVGPMTIAQNGLTSAFYSRNRMTAVFLAQDAIEYIKGVRDENVSTPNWLDKLDSCFVNQANDPGCRINTISDTNSISTEDGLKLNFNPSDNSYNYDINSGAASPFTRNIKIEKISVGGGENAIFVRVVVNWRESTGGQNSVEVSNLLYNWR